MIRGGGRGPDLGVGNRRHFQRSDLDLVETFHEATKIGRMTAESLFANVRAHLTDPALVRSSLLGRHPRRSGTHVSLPTFSIKSSTTLNEAMASRRSAAREAIRKRLSLVDLADVLRSVGGNLPIGDDPTGSGQLNRRAYPSAGALYPCELYVVSSGTEGLLDGVYLFDADRQVLWLITDDITAAHRADMQHDSQHPVPCMLVVTAVPARAIVKYGLKGYRLAVMEAGHLSQNVLLTAAARGLQALPYASVFERELERGLEVNGVDEVVLATVLLGA